MLLSACKRPATTMPSLQETYTRTDKNPFGTYVAFRQVNELFYRNNISIQKTALDVSLSDTYQQAAALYICISRHFYLRPAEQRALLQYVEKGNQAFISAQNFDTAFLQQLKLALAPPTVFAREPNPLHMQHTSLSLAAPPFAATQPYGYYYLPFTNSFSIAANQNDTKVLGVNQSGQPDFIVLMHGRGRLYLHSEPRAFSNYFLLQPGNYQYLQQAFSFMPRVPNHIVWDDYYNRRHLPPSPTAIPKDQYGNEPSGLDVLLKYKEMAWAFWLLVFLLALYILFGSKRRQRAIQPLAPKSNTSVAFTETVAGLYLQKKDNRNMADKMITYLLEHIRNRYFMSAGNINAAFTDTLSRKTNLPAAQVQQLCDSIASIQQSSQVSDEELLKLHVQIENFINSVNNG